MNTKTTKRRAKPRTEEKLFPIYHNGENYYKKDCDDLFLCFYHTRYALGLENSVYVGDGLRVCPDGKCIEQ